MREDLQKHFSQIVEANVGNTEVLNSIQNMTTYIDELEAKETPDMSQYVSVEEYNKLKKDYVNRFFSGGQVDEKPQPQEEEKPKSLGINDLFE